MSPARRAPKALTLEALLRQAPWFAQLDADAQRQVLRDASEQPVAKGAPVGWRGEVTRFWYGVLEGLFKWSVVGPDGREVTLGGQSVGSWFNEATLLRGTPREADVVALRDSRVAILPYDTFDWLRRTQPGFNEFLLQQVSERLLWLMGDYAAHRLLDTDRQVARALCGLASPLQNPHGETRLQLSQEELAHLATVSRQRCNRALARLKDQGLVRIEYGGVTLLDLPGLQRFST